MWFACERRKAANCICLAEFTEICQVSPPGLDWPYLQATKIWKNKCYNSVYICILGHSSTYIRNHKNIYIRIYQNIHESNVSGTLSEAVHVALRQWRIAADASQTEKSHGKVAPKVSMAHSVALLLMAPATSIPCTSRPSKAKQSQAKVVRAFKHGNTRSIWKHY